MKVSQDFLLQLTNECAGLNLHSLSAMEEQSTEISSMEGIFKKAMLISAHFKYMAEDWRNGRECNGASRSNLTKAFERYVYLAFNPVNCFLFILFKRELMLLALLHLCSFFLLFFLSCSIYCAKNSCRILFK